MEDEVWYGSGGSTGGKGEDVGPAEAEVGGSIEGDIPVGGDADGGGGGGGTLGWTGVKRVKARSVDSRVEVGCRDASITYKIQKHFISILRG